MRAIRRYKNNTGAGTNYYNNPNLHFFGDGFVNGTGNGPNSFSTFSFGFGYKYKQYGR